MYKKVYGGAIFGTNSASQWTQTLFIPPFPPNFGRGAGRPSKARKRGPEEPKKKKSKNSVKMFKQGWKVTCKKCGLTGHNTRSCDRRKKQGGQVDSILQRKRARSSNRQNNANTSQSSTSVDRPTMLPPNTEEGSTYSNEELQFRGPNCPEYQIPIVPSKAGPSPFEQLQHALGYKHSGCKRN
ncbi:gag-pol polyprotein [Striga asiatica]|uniref:Gag-pol polyprotein n=1 Tax=Striga asiatica TaxID=4170 RepID=A0A5A7QLK2_STRAF|nr:gag-pol polyprotein [Striga asiatica]